MLPCDFLYKFLSELGNVEQAAIKAGYSKVFARGNAHKFVANVEIYGSYICF
ncbi:terminase small subunit [Lysinibacillus xylanilyticus]|uniref:terminase small subunit n=1 Tax=Lysinibacillus xylanilyticus TaxID=582475 RepID=UPI003CFCE885